MLFRVSIPLLFLSLCTFAQDAAPDGGKLDLTLSYWPVHSSGSIRASGANVDLRSDLGVAQNTPTFAGSLDLRFGRSRIRAEGTPIRLTGDRSLQRTIVYHGRTFDISDRVTSSADVDYFYGGYEFDILSRPGGHLGIEAGGAYFSAGGTITSQTTGVTASRSETVGMPLVGIAFRAFPVHGRFDVEVNGEIKGMQFGGFGHYVQTTANIGVGRGYVLVEAGYRFIDADVHQTNGANAVTPQFRGPVVSLLLRL
jgi:hypothetical protein